VAEERKESASLAKPAEFFIGLVDFFAILLPGAIATGILLQLAKTNCELHYFYRQSILGELPEGQYWPRWIAIAVISYLLGHFIFLIGSASLDNLYDLTYKLVHKDKEEAGKLQGRAKTLLNTALRIPEEEVHSTYQWTRVYARLRSPATSLEIDRFEADSKFFRSLTVLLFLAGFLLPAALSAKVGWIIFAVLVVLTLFIAAVLLNEGWRKTSRQKTNNERAEDEEKIRLKAYERYEKRQKNPNSKLTAQDDWSSAKASLDGTNIRICCAWTILASAASLQFVFYLDRMNWHWYWFVAQFASLVCLLLSGWRFMERRYKGVAFAYRLLLATVAELTSQAGSHPTSKHD
jgi:Protein of unknown function (DUF2934)